MFKIDENTDLKTDNCPAIKNLILPKLSNQYTDPSVFSTSPETVRCVAEFLQTEVPHINYYQYKKYHASKKPKHNRSQSDSPSINFYYIPQVIRVAPRSTVKVFSNFQISKPNKRVDRVKNKKFNNRNFPIFGNQAKILPILNKKVEKPKIEIKASMTYGEKLWKLHELACMDFKEKKQLV